MKLHWPALIGVGLVLVATGEAQDLTPTPVISDAEIQALLTERIHDKRQTTGIVVGVIEDRGERIVAQGSNGPNDQRPLDGNSVFELGGVTGVFTSLLLADMVQRGEVSLFDPVAKYLPPGTKVPAQGNRQITLVDLATHTSCLPLLPSNFKPKDPANPWADYTEDDLYKFLAGYTLTGSLGTDYNYSNVGLGLLGIALSHRAGMPYDALVRGRIFGPLNMKSSGVTLTPEMKARQAIGHNARLQPVGYWDAPALPGAVALHSTVQDLLTFLEAALGYRPNPLSNAMNAMLATRRPTRHPGLELALGWHQLTTQTAQIMWHNGGTGGCRAFLGFAPKSKTGIVVLSNTESTSGIDDLGMRLFTSTPPDLLYSRERKAVAVDPRVLATYVGSYQLPDGTLLEVVLSGKDLQAKIGKTTFALTPESSRDFFVKDVEGQLSFVTDRGGAAYMAILHQSGTDIPAKRVN